MSILIDSNTKVIIQGGTGRQGRLHANLMKSSGTDIRGLITVVRKSESVDGMKVYESVAEITEKEKIDASILFTPPGSSKDAAVEAIYNGIKLIVLITEHVPIKDAIYLRTIAEKFDATLIGPNTIGLISPGKCKIGVMPADIYKKGSVGVLSRSGTLTHEVSSLLSDSGLGITTSVDIGGDMVVGTDYTSLISEFERDDETEVIVVIGEIGGRREQLLAKYISENITKPVVAYVAGRTAPQDKRMGHAGAIVAGRDATAEAKLEAYRDAGVSIADYPDQIPSKVLELIKN